MPLHSAEEHSHCLHYCSHLLGHVCTCKHTAQTPGTQPQQHQQRHRLSLGTGVPAWLATQAELPGPCTARALHATHLEQIHVEVALQVARHACSLQISHPHRGTPGQASQGAGAAVGLLLGSQPAPVQGRAADGSCRATQPQNRGACARSTSLTWFCCDARPCGPCRPDIGLVEGLANAEWNAEARRGLF
jgi:hypothetical protein